MHNINKHMTIRPNVIKYSSIGAAVIVIGILSFIFLPSALSSLLPKAMTSSDEITIAPRKLSFMVEASGTIRATAVRNYAPPEEFLNYWQFQIVDLVPEGKVVKAGEVLMTFDAQRVRLDLQKFQNDLDQATKELEKTKAEKDLQTQELTAKLATAENNYSKLKLKQAHNPQFDPPIQVELDKLAFEQARREVDALKERLEWHEKSSRASYDIIATKKSRAQNKVDEIKRGMGNFQVKADKDGVVIYKSKWNGERYQVGENVWAGMNILEIPDLSTLLVDSNVPEVDVAKIQSGQKVRITLDAFPERSFTGTVKGTGKLIHSKSWDIPNRILDTQVTFDTLDTGIMRPGMSAKTQIETASISNVLAVPLKAIRTTPNGSLVKLKTKSGPKPWIEHPVKLGDSNGTEVIIKEGLKPGDVIAADYLKTNE